MTGHRLQIILYSDNVRAPSVIDEIGVHGCYVQRGPAKVRMPPTERRLLLILAVRQHVTTSIAELVDAMWGDDPDGGPETAEKVILVNLTSLRDAGAALGFRIENIHGRGWRLVTAKEHAHAA